MRIVFIIWLLILGSCNKSIRIPLVDPGASTGEVDTPFGAANMTLGNLHHYNESIITLSYTGTEEATTCTVSELSHLIESTPCSCTAGVCKVGVSGDSLAYTGGAGFSFTVSTDTETTNTANVSLTIAAPTPFVTTWKTDNTAFGTSAANQVKLPLKSNLNYNFVVDWGDGNSSTITTWNDPLTTHTYASAGTYDVSITGIFEGLSFGSDYPKILDVKSWGSYPWVELDWAFDSCENLNVTATDAPNLTRVTSLEGMFYSASNMNGDLSNWDTSNVTNMSYMFNYAFIFNQNIGSWDTSKVTNMNSMFDGANAFNQDISNWDVSNVEDMGFLFSSCYAFNQPIGSWNTSKVLNMNYMFFENYAFNQPIGSWDTSNVTSMRYMFERANGFNQDISSWNTANVTAMTGMFLNANAFNQPIGAWNTANVTNSSAMFRDATAFNQDISNWDVSNVTNMNAMFMNASLFNQDISSWNIANVTNVGAMFQNATAFNQDLSSWTWSGVGKPLPTNLNFDTGATAWVLPRPTW